MCVRTPRGLRNPKPYTVLACLSEKALRDFKSLAPEVEQYLKLRALYLVEGII